MLGVRATLGVHAAVAGYGLGEYAGIFRRPGAGGEASEAAARASTHLPRHVSARASSESCSESRPDIRSGTRLRRGGGGGVPAEDTPTAEGGGISPAARLNTPVWPRRLSQRKERGAKEVISYTYTWALREGLGRGVWGGLSAVLV